MIANIATSCSGTMEVHREGASPVVVPWTNTILDIGFDRLANGSALAYDPNSGNGLMYFVFGTGSTPTTPEMTQLAAPIQQIYNPSITVEVLSKGYDPQNPNIFEFVLRNVCSFAMGSIQGNIAEFGLTNSSSWASNYRIMTRILLKDNQGQPTTVPITNKDQLILRYDHKYRMDTSALTYNLNVDTNGSITQHQVVSTFEPHRLNQLQSYSASSLVQLTMFNKSVTAANKDRGNGTNVGTATLVRRPGTLIYDVTMVVGTNTAFNQVTTTPYPGFECITNGHYAHVFTPGIPKTQFQSTQLKFELRYSRG